MSVITVSCNPKATHAHVSFTPSVKDFDMHQQSSVQRDVTNAPLLRSHGSLEDLDACSAAFYGGDGINNAYNTPHFDHASKEYNYEFRREGVRAPLRDRTYCDHQSYNVTRSRESDSVDLSSQYVSKNSNSQSRMNMDHAIRMYAHNPYKPLLMRDANGECINNGVEDGNDTPGALFYASMLPIQYSQCTPQKSGETLGPKASSNIDTMTTDALNGNETNARSSSMHGIQYVNGRPVVMKTTSTSIPQSTSSITTTPSSLLATTPNVCSSHENPFDGVQSSSDLFDHLFEEDTVAMAEDLTAPTNERFQQPQIPVHSSFSKSSAFSTSASSASVRPHLRRLPTDASSTTKLTEPLPNKYALSSSARRFVTTGNYFPPSSSVQGNSEPSDGYQSTTSRSNRQGAGTLYPDAHDLPSSSDVTNYEVEWREDISEDQKVEAVGADGHDSMFENKTEQRDMYLVQISFRHRSASYLSPFSLEVDEYCIVEGDQGHDLGRVSNITINSQLSQTMNDPNRGSRAKYDLVIRKATPMEAQEYLTTQRDAEDSALDHIRCEVLRLRLPMNVQSCEYQYDRRKLSFYFESERKVTFAPLLKCLHRHYQCRIWLQQVNRSPAHHS